MITLSGGPFDGETHPDVAGDILNMQPPLGAPRIVLDFSVPTVEPFRIERCVYRRSLGNPNIYVFQP